MVLLYPLVLADVLINRLFEQDGVEVNLAVFPVLHIAAQTQEFHFAHHFIDGTEAQFSHDAAQVFGQKAEEVDDVFRLAAEALAQFGVLGRNAYRASIHVAFAHHDATFYHECGGSNAPFFGAQEGGYGDVFTCTQLAIRLYHYPVAQFIAQQGVVGLGQAQFPGQTRVTNRSQRRSARSSIVARDQNGIGVRFGYPRSNDPYSRFRHEFDVDARSRVGIFEVKNQLRQILNGINIVVRRRRNQAYPWCGMPYAANPFIHFMAGQLPTFTRLGTLRHFDLQFSSVAEVITGYSKTTGSHLFDGRTFPIAIFFGFKADLVFTAFATVAFAANTVHGNGQGRVGFVRNGPK